MGIFKTELCPICGQSTNAFQKTSMKYNGFFICKKCYKKIIKSGVNALQIKHKDIQELKGIIKNSNELEKVHANEINDFLISKKVGQYLYLDEKHRKFAIPKLSALGKVKDLDIYNYSDILDFELLEDGESISKGGVGRAIVGGVLFGSVGAIVGGSTGHKQKLTCTNMKIKITMNNINNPVAYIVLISAETKKEGYLYKLIAPKAQEILSLLDIICKANESIKVNNEQNTTSSPADEILKYKQLLDMGAITQEEFDTKKKQILEI